MQDFTSRGETESGWLQRIAATSSADAAVELAPGALLCGSRYRVERELGRGGMGIVYAAWDEERRELVALKTLNRRSPASIYRIKQEFRGLSHVRHDNLVRLYELFEDQGRWCFTLELVPGLRLLQALQGASAESIRPALQQLAAGIHALHLAGKLHRDLKPSNVLITPTGRPVILDFGLAQDIRQESEVTPLTAVQSGTPAYMAPELRSGGAASQASDWYSFGVIVSQWLTGRLPSRHDPLPAPSGEAPSAPASDQGFAAQLGELCRALLSGDPARRPDAAAVLRCLDPHAELSAGEPWQLREADPHARELFGRAQELAWLHQAHAASCAVARPVVALVSGESGIGKTALVHRFLSELRGCCVLAGRCYERELVPYKAFDAVIDELSRQLARWPALELAELLPADFAALCRLFPVLGRVSEPLAHGQGPSDDAHELRRRGFEALGILLGRLRQRCPVVLWVDDLQWTDADSLSLLLHLLRHPEAPRLLLVVSYRSDPGTQHAGLLWLFEALNDDVRLDVRSLALAPLCESAAAALLESVNPGAPPALVEQAHGHPFLLEELSRYASSRSLTSPAQPCEAWPSLEQALAARIATLAAEERRLLELLAIAGRPLPEPIARAAAGRSWHAAVQALCSARLVRRSPTHGTLSCYHDAIRAVTANAVRTQGARQHHRALALALLRAGAAPPEQLASHLAGSGHPQRAAEQTLLAARQAAASLAFERGAQLYQSALELGRFDAAARRHWEVARADALAAAGHGSEAAASYLAVLNPDDAATALELRMRAAEQYLLSGRLEPGLGLLSRALASLGVQLHTSAAATIASFVYHRARLRLRGHHFEARPVPAATAQRLALLQRASAALTRLDPLRASELASRTLLLALESGSTEAIAGASVSDLLIAVFFRVSDAEFRRRRERAENACARFGSAQDQVWLQGTLAAAARLRGEPDLRAALAHFERVFELHRLHVLPRASYERPWDEWGRAVVRCLLGELAAVAREVPARMDEGWSRGDHCIVPLWAGGDPLLVRLAVGDVAAAERDLTRAQRAWSSRSFSLQDLMLVIGASHLCRFRGDTEGAWQVAEEARQRLAQSPARRMPNFVDAIQALRGHAALDLAARTRSPERRRELLALVRGLVLQRSGRPPLVAVLRGPVLAAAWHHQQGDGEGTLRALAQAESQLRSIPLFAEAVRHRRGLLAGGAEGMAAAARAEQFLAAGGAVEPGRILGLLLPGYEPARSL